MLTDPFDCNVYLLDGGDELALVDAGAGRDTDSVLRAVEDCGYDPARIRHVLLTHGHADHAGGCAGLRQRLGAAVWASEETARFVRDGDEQAISLDVARAAGGYPADYRFAACPVNQIVEDGTPFTIGALVITPLATPGHANGHTAYLVNDGERRCLFAGDLLMCGGRVLLQYTHDCSLPLLGASLRRLHGLSVDALFPGHFHFCLREGQSHIEAAIVHLDRLQIPPGAL
jgi:glyoxylase-like metal-dependent hydrolase (beta-lactamase superfamily II)